MDMITLALAKKYTDEKAGGNYELIETITIAEPTSQIVRSEEPDGTPYAFKAIYFGIHGSNNSSASVWTYLYSRTGEMLASVQVGASVNYSAMELKAPYGIVEGWSFAPSMGVQLAYRDRGLETLVERGYENGVFDYIKFTSGQPLAAGTKIHILGARA